MAQVQEHELMTRFYLSSGSVQQALLDDYQHLAGSIRKEHSFLEFLKEHLEAKVIPDKMYKGMTMQTFPQVSV